MATPKYAIGGCVTALILLNPGHRQFTRHTLELWPDATSHAAVATIAQTRQNEPWLAPGFRTQTVRRHTRKQDAVVQRFVALPLRFERNVGQSPRAIDALVHGHRYSLQLADGDPVLTFCGGGDRHSARGSREVRMTLLGRRPSPRAIYEEQLPGVSNYLIGDRAGWLTDVPTYAGVQYNEIYPGIDLVFYGRLGDLEYDFVVAPGADPGRIRFEIEGADNVRLAEDGALEVRVGENAIALAPPVVYQRRSDGRRETVEGTYRLAGRTVEFSLGPYDPAITLVIDPVLVYSAPVSPPGSLGHNYAAGVATDAAGNGYLFSTQNAVFGVSSLVGDMVVTKLNAAGALVYSTTLGSGQAGAIAVSPAGEVFVAGKGAFPDVPGFRGWGSEFSVAKLNAAGNTAIYKATIGNDISAIEALHLAVGPSGQAALTGATGPRNFTLANAVQPVHGGGGYDAFALVLNPTGDQLMFSTYLGGIDWDVGRGLVVHEDGTIRVVGETRSANFPTIMGFQTSLAGPADGFVTTFSPAGAITQSTFLGGSGSDAVRGVSLGPMGVMHVAGKTDSMDFPLKYPLEATPRGAFLTRLAPDGREMVYSTYFGGTGDDTIAGVATDAEGSTYVAGSTTSIDFPLRIAIQGYSGSLDGFVAKFGPAGDLLHSTYFGGTLVGLAVAPAGHVYVGRRSMPGLYVPGSAVSLARLATNLEVTGVSPTIMPAGMTGRVTFTGRNFAAGARLFAGGQWATDITVNSPTGLSAVLPALPAGIHDVVIVNPSPYDELVALPNAVEYTSCSFTIPPTHGFTGQGGTRSIAIQSTPAGCGWQAETRETWISVDTPSAGSAAASVRITVSPNLGRTVRYGTLRVAGRMIDIIQGPSTVLDVDFDRKLDLIWHHQIDGRLAVWLMNGLTLTAGVPLWPPSVPDSSWKVVGSADLDGDGYSDLVWQNVADGRVATWLMKGLTSREGLLLTPGQVADTDWRIRAVGDFNGDGRADLIWQHESQGLVAVWIMAGLQLIDGRLLNPDHAIDLSWRIVGSGDFDGDGHRDLLWRHAASGQISAWLMNGTTMVSTLSFAPESVEDPDWKIRAVGDIDGDGQPDLIWQHQTTGGVSVWLMDGTIRRMGVELTPSHVSDTNWHIVGPR